MIWSIVMNSVNINLPHQMRISVLNFVSDALTWTVRKQILEANNKIDG